MRQPILQSPLVPQTTLRFRSKPTGSTFPPTPQFGSASFTAFPLTLVLLALLQLAVLSSPARSIATNTETSLVTPGGTEIRLDGLRSFEAIYADHRGEQRGTRVHRLERLTAMEKPALRFTITMHGRGIVEDELTFDATNGAPLARRIFAPSLLHRVETWNGNTVDWVDIAIDGSGATNHGRQFDTLPLTMPPELLAAALALEPGDRHFVPSFSTDLGADAPGFLLALEALKHETITTPAGTFECLRVRTEMRTLTADPIEAAPLGLPARTLWIQNEAPYLVRAAAEMQGVELTQELEQVRWLGPASAATGDAEKPERSADALRTEASTDHATSHGLLHRLVDWFHGLHGHVHF